MLDELPTIEIIGFCTAFTEARNKCKTQATAVNTFGYTVCSQHHQAQPKLDPGHQTQATASSLTTWTPTSQVIEYEQAILF